jgi:hypothetical protein
MSKGFCVSGRSKEKRERRAEKNKDKMKPTNLNNWARNCGRLTTLILIAGSILTITAADIPTGKGAAKLLMKPVAPATASAMGSMSCTKCTDKFVAVRDITARGVNKPTTLVAQHGCPGCSTSFTTAGVGKAKQTVALHTCASAVVQNKNCCARN